MTTPFKLDLIDAERMARDNPDTFTVPSPQRLAAVRAGWYIKVCRHDERFWICVISRTTHGFVGRVANKLVLEANLELPMGSVIHVELRHVYDAMAPGEMA